MSTSLVKRELGLGTLTELEGGKAALIFQKKLKEVLMDCLNRPGEAKERTVTLKVRITPKTDPDGKDCEGIRAAFDVDSKLPPLRTNPVDLNVTNAGQAWFTVEEEEDPANH